jgi:hypothetical protein
MYWDWLSRPCEAMGRRQTNISIFVVLKEISEMSVSFNVVTLIYANWKCNRVAHKLAKKASSVMVARVWHETPTCIEHLLAKYCNSLCHVMNDLPPPPHPHTHTKDHQYSVTMWLEGCSIPLCYLVITDRVSIQCNLLTIIILCE